MSAGTAKASHPVHHKGFLQVNHEYEVSFSIPDDLGPDVTTKEMDSLHARILHIKPSASGEGHDLVVSLSAKKETLMIEELNLSAKDDPNKKVGLLLKARVLGHGKGTPLLRTGIHCTKKFDDDSSVTSGWDGFQ